MNARLFSFALAAVALAAVAVWFFGAPNLPGADPGVPSELHADSPPSASTREASADGGLALEADSGLALDAGSGAVLDAGPPPPGPAVRAPSEAAAEGNINGAQAGAETATAESDNQATPPDPDRDNTPGALGEEDTQFARFVALMDTRYASFRQGAEDCVESLPDTVNAQLEVRITRNDLGDPYDVQVTGAELPQGVTDCLVRKARAIDLPQPFRVDPYESDDYDVDSQTDSEFDWVTRVQLGR